ncbi:ABC-F family ATP-binding cassette domain-containing protein [Spirochaeta africana]|uniref:ATPase component of ABC transporters with duplicated ATPase domain n=1 Tax=Spirochaeta africana (strain ATCC 700263 / DSM 8902 / Z-7692) TaxID=889378 RepID=H9UG06_SPIAZ|nr:ABC-F family ATP-binding cassette domain-containing protein [Spirochaeta africana]AFG36449.1 ATPase component of ABC transporters with duplicated ATPase domain [Spirochaeta africana DSM 8902]
MIKLSKTRLSYGDRCLFANASMLVRSGDKIGLVGPNGAGKTSVFRLITGEETPDEGQVILEGSPVIGYFSQETGEMAGRSVIDEVLSGAGRLAEMGRQIAELEQRMSEGEPLSEAEMDRYGELQMEFAHRGGYDLENSAESILSGLGIGPDRWQDAVETFSGGWKMRIALAKILLLNPDVLLIDEPTNHLDIESILWLEEWLKQFAGAVVMTSHDRAFMTRICTRTVEVAGGTITTYSGDYDFYLQEREIRREQLIAAQRRQQAMLAKEEEFIARFAARASHAAQVQSRVKNLEKIERIVVPPDPKTMKIEWPPIQRSGDVVATMEDLGKAWELPGGGSHPVFSGISGVVERTNRIAVTGINGAGKSTLLKVLTGQTAPSQGSSQLGAGVQVGYFSQYSGDVLNPDNTILEEVQQRLPLAPIGTIKSILGSFQFSGDESDKKISVLSGGEKSRVILACILAQPVNFLVLDEPTNHLDITSREVLLDALQRFEGTIMIVSHDRWFLQHLVNRVFEIDHGRMRIYEGDYQYYLEARSPATAAS